MGKEHRPTTEEWPLVQRLSLYLLKKLCLSLFFLLYTPSNSFQVLPIRISGRVIKYVVSGRFPKKGRLQMSLVVLQPEYLPSSSVAHCFFSLCQMHICPSPSPGMRVFSLHHKPFGLSQIIITSLLCLVSLGRGTPLTDSGEAPLSYSKGRPIWQKQDFWPQGLPLLCQEQLLESAEARTSLPGPKDRLPCAGAKRDFEDVRR